MPVEFDTSNSGCRQQEGLPVPSYLGSRNSRPQAYNVPFTSRDVDVSKSPFDKVQLTKLLIDTLHEIGYTESAVTLQKESGGVEVKSSNVQKLFSAIQYGQFELIDLNMLVRLPMKHGGLKSFLQQHAQDFSQTRASSQDSNMESETTVCNEDSAMKIENLIAKRTDWHRFFETMEKDLAVLDPLAQNMADCDVKTLTSMLDTVEMLVLINKQVFLELMFDQQDSSLAVFFLRTVLRKYIQLWESLLMYQESSYALTPDTLLKQMTSILTCPLNSAELSDVWSGSLESSRQLLIRSISNYIDPNNLVPRGRLLTLLSQAIKYQNSQDVLNFEDEDDTFVQEGSRHYNLLQDNSCSSQRISFAPEKLLAQNADEIWYLEFSPDGRYLASASADSSTDRKVLIYDVERDFQVYKVLAGNDQCVLYLSFSPDSKYLVSCPFNEDAKIYDIHKEGEPTDLNQEYEGAFVAEIIQPEDSFKIYENEGTSSVSSPRIWCCSWFHTERNRGRFALGSPDRDVIIYDIGAKSVLCKLSQVLSLNASLSQEPFSRVHDLKITCNDKYLILMAHEFYVDTYDISQLPPVQNGDRITESNIETIGFHVSKVSRLSVGKRMTCLTIPQIKDHARDENSLILINVQPHELQLWDFKEQILVQKYYGQRQLQFIIRSCFGYDNKLVASGSEDGKIYIWDRFHGNIVSVINGHDAERPTTRISNKTFGRNCNIVVWNPTNKNIFASGGDDGLVKIWKVVRGQL
ncbi:LAME_0G01002g1_1 [Lachancea meyersii CBS 8951]|uniref:LAME_0G01002g1_1 n=1 Tax=Lachancea meyersii CBS 8951 TaxID=1266667 RepID=A0A1G4K5B7_9SACH|nr:LAME_0G01002g1_1 [Lachancea meyersii CBS 8951]